jgi:uncharacterized protein (TIGR00159 family)
MGMLLLALVYMAARMLGMTTTVWLLQGFFAVSVIVIVVIFQEELRYAFERIAMWSLRRGGREPVTPEAVETLVTSVAKLAEEHIGALIVLHGRDPLDRHVDGGWSLDGEVSLPLLDSIFDTHSLGHDGAVIIENGRVARFGCHLPLSKEFAATTDLGTRHTAALGVSERTDAFCIVVSEERGTIRLTRHGELEVMPDAAALRARIERFVAEMAPRPAKDTLKMLVTHNMREKGMALAVSTLMWMLLAGVGT